MKLVVFTLSEVQQKIRSDYIGVFSHKSWHKKFLNQQTI